MNALAQSNAQPKKRGVGRARLGFFASIVDRQGRTRKVRGLSGSTKPGRLHGSYSAKSGHDVLSDADLRGLRDLLAHRMKEIVAAADPARRASFAQAFREIYVEHRPETMSRARAERQARAQVRRWQTLLKRRGFYPR